MIVKPEVLTLNRKIANLFINRNVGVAEQSTVCQLISCLISRANQSKIQALQTTQASIDQQVNSASDTFVCFANSGCVTVGWILNPKVPQNHWGPVTLRFCSFQGFWIPRNLGFWILNPPSSRHPPPLQHRPLPAQPLLSLLAPHLPPSKPHPCRLLTIRIRYR